MDAVREEATRRYVARLAPKYGEPTHGNRDIPDEGVGRGEEDGRVATAKGRDAKIEKSGPAEGKASSGDGALTKRFDSLKIGGQARRGKNGRSGSAHDKPERGHDAGAGADSGTAPSKVTVGTLNAEVRRAARAYIERRESEFWVEAKAREAGAVERSAQRVLNNELLEARLRAWPLARVLWEVESAYRAALSEREENWRRGVRDAPRPNSAPQPEPDLNPAVDARRDVSFADPEAIEPTEEREADPEAATEPELSLIHI